MRISNGLFDLTTFTIKPSSGTYGTGLLVVNKLSKELRIGNYIFPLAGLNKLSLDSDGTAVINGSRFEIVLDSEIHTPNIVYFETVQNITAEQQVSFVIQHGGQSAVLNNLSVQKVVLPHIAGEIVNITVINYSTGATTAQTITPVAGSAYSLSAVSSSSSTGSLTTPCVRTELDIANAPIAGTDSNDDLELTVALDSGVQPSDVEARRAVAVAYNQLLAGVLTLTNGKTHATYLAEWDALIRSQAYLTIGNNTTSIPISSGDIIDLTGGTTASVAKGTYKFGNNLVSVNVPSTGKYQIFFDMQVPFPKLTPPSVDPVSGGYRATMTQQWWVYTSLMLKGPIQNVCAQTTTIDTRRTIYSVALTITALN